MDWEGGVNLSTQICKVHRMRSSISEASYWYNIMPKDGASTATAPANAIYKYRVQEKGIHALQIPDDEEKHRPYAVGDIVWIKSPGNRCTTKFTLRWVTGVVSHHSVNGVLHHIKDLCPFQEPIPPSERETDSENHSTEGGIPITLGPTPLDDTPDTTRLEADDSSADPSSSEDDIPIVPFSRSTQQKRPTWSCMVCSSLDQPVENEIAAALGLALLDNTLNAIRLNAVDPSADESSSESDASAALLRRSTRQKKLTPSCTVCNQNEGAFLLNTKECAPMLSSHCAKCANSIHINVVPLVSLIESFDLRIKGVHVHRGSKAPSFAKCLKHKGNLTHFSC